MCLAKVTCVSLVYNVPQGIIVHVACSNDITILTLVHTINHINLVHVACSIKSYKLMSVLDLGSYGHYRVYSVNSGAYHKPYIILQSNCRNNTDITVIAHYTSRIPLHA